MRKKCLYIHIGTGKTGSSALQEFFYSNKSRIRKVGLNYCEAGAVSTNHHLLCRNFQRGSQEVQEKITTSIAALKEEIKKSSCIDHLISSEYFPGLFFDEIRELVGSLTGVCDVKMIAYVRRQDDFLESWYSQIVKANDRKASIQGLEKRLFDDGVFDYFTLAELWADAGCQVIVKPYEKKQFSGSSIFDDFGKSIDRRLGEMDGLVWPSKETNPSLSVEQVYLKNELYDFSDHEQKQILSYPFRFNFPSSKHFLPPAERRRILTNCSENNAKLAKKYLSRDYLFEASEVSCDWFSGDLFESGYLRSFLTYMKYENPDSLKRLEGALVRYLKVIHDNVKNTDWVRASECLFMASYLRPGGADIERKAHALFS